MPVFQSKKFRASSYRNGLGALYRSNLNSHPFLLFGLPFIFTIVAGMSFSGPILRIANEAPFDERVPGVQASQPLRIVIDGRRLSLKKYS